MNTALNTTLSYELIETTEARREFLFPALPLMLIHYTHDDYEGARYELYCTDLYNPAEWQLLYTAPYEQEILDAIEFYVDTNS